MGIVFTKSVSDEQARVAARLAELHRLPALLLDSEDKRIGETHNEIAILDTEKQKLYVNPDLETIGGYFGTESRQSPHTIELFLETKNSDFPRKLPEGCDGLVIGEALGNGASEQECYEYFCDVADTHTGAEIVAKADLALGSDTFLARVRAIYRASVWGRFFLLCTSVSTPEREHECISALHRAFCMLDDERREFNGFIPKGILIDTPMMLFSRHKPRLIDFFVLDIERIRHLMTASTDKALGARQTASYALNFANTLAGIPISLQGVDRAAPDIIRSLLQSKAISCIYTASPSQFTF